MTKFKLVLFFLISNYLILIKTQEPITNAQRIFEFINYGPIGLFYGILPSLNELNITQQCQLSLNHLINSLHDGQLWANLMIASSGKGLQNLLEGSYLNLGNYDQCLSIESIKINSTELLNNKTTDHYFNGQYCILDIIPEPSLLTPYASNDSLRQKDFLNPTLNVSQKLDTLFKFTEQLNSKIGFCLPSVCNSKDVTVLINSVLEEYLWKLFKPVNCQIKQKLFEKILTDSNVETKISLLILFALLSCVLISTILHLILIKNDGLLNDLIKCFSLKNNFSILLSSKYEDNLILNIIQSLAILFCIISHSYLYFIWLDAYVFYDKIYDYLFNIKYIFYQPFLNVFDISNGLLFLITSTFVCIKLFSIKITFKRCLKEIVDTYIRYLLIMIVLICIQITLPVFISGPIANEYLERDAKFCYQSWYKNLLFMNNFNDFDKQCVLHSWTISTNMQMFTLLVLLIYIYSKVPILAKILNLFLIFASLISIWMIVYLNFLSPQLLSMPFNLNKLKIRAKLIYFPPYVYLLEYFLPCFIINLIFNKCNNRFHTKTRRTILYLLILAFLIIQFYSFPFASLDYQGTNILNAFVVLTCKTILPSVFAWIIYNYYGFNLGDIFKEIGLNLFKFNLFSDTTRNLNRKITDLTRNQKTELEMVSNIKEENNRLMNDRNSRIIDDHLIINDKLLIDKIETIDKLMENDLLKMKLNELILNENLLLTNLINDKLNEKSINPIIEKVSFKKLFIIYTQLAQSIFYSHHFYLIYDLYTIRTSLSTDLYSIISRIIYNLFYIHLIAILFYLFIEHPLYSIIKLVYKQILNRKNI